MEKNMKNSVCMLGFAKGSESKESTGFKKYIGIGVCQVLGVNPNKAEMEKIYDTTFEKEPEYLGEVESNGKQVKTVRVNFILKTVAEANNGIEAIVRASFMLRNEMRVGSNSGKIQVIDKYGRTAWATEEECKTHTIPMYKNGPANIDKDFRPCYAGEENLTNFIKTYLGIPEVMKYVNGSWVMVEHPEECEARLENVAKYFNGDFSELKEVLALQPNNKIKALIGVQNAENGNTYQRVFAEKFLKNNSTYYVGLEKELNARKEAGAYADTEFEVCELKEYTVNATSFESSNKGSEDMPFAAPAADSPWGFN